MSDVRYSADKVVAIACSDLHLSVKPPVWRSNEPDWYEAMARPLQKLRAIQEQYGVPVLCAGDIFDNWACNPELINFAIKNLPKKMYAIPGQHDLPLHSKRDIRKSAYYTLVLSGVVKHPSNLHCEYFRVYGFDYGEEITPPPCPDDFNIALVHQYLWTDGKGYKGCPKEGNVSSKNLKTLRKYNIVISGDNHQGFIEKVGKTTFCNCGSMMRTHADQRDYQPCFYLIHKYGEVESVPLDCSKDVCLAETNKIQEARSMEVLEDFFDEMRKLGNSGVDFVKALNIQMEKNDISPEVTRFVRGVLEEAKKE